MPELVRHHGKRLGAFALALAVALSATSIAAAELSQKGDLFVRFDGGISPKALPRKAPAPIAVRIEGTIRAPAAHDPPALSRIRIALNRSGKLDSRGLPTCRRSQIVSTNPTEAVAVCGASLVGSGGIVAETSFPGQAHYLLRGELTLFNSSEHGRPTILAHLYQSTAAPITNIITFRVQRASGAFGTVITAEMPPALQRYGYLKSIFLRLQRSYVYRGRHRAYLSASCAAPAGFSVATFPFAKAAMSFDDGRVLSATLIRSCRVSG
jgi:hypothetical protein